MNPFKNLFKTIYAVFALAAKPEQFFKVENYDPPPIAKSRNRPGRASSNPNRFHGYRYPFEVREARQ